MHCCWEVSSLVEPLEISRDVPAKTLTEQGAAAHMSKLLYVVTTLTDRRAARCIAAGRCRGSWSPPQDIQACASKNPHGTRGCRAHVQASGCCNNPHRSKGCQTRCCWEVSRPLKVLRISRDVPAKTLTEQGGAGHMSKLLDVVANLTDRRAARCIAAGRCRGSRSPPRYPGMCQQKPLQNNGAAAHVQASGCCNNPQQSAARRVTAIAKGPAEGPQKWSGSC